MTATPTAIVESKFIEATETTQFTANSATIIDAAVVANISAGAVDLNLSLVPSGDTASEANLIIANLTLRSGESYLCPDILGQVLEPGDFISAIAGAGDSLNIRVSGRVLT